MPLPAFYRPEEVAEHFGWTERFVRSTATALGACRGTGHRMRLLPEDVDTILEAIKCHSTSSDVTASGITPELLAHLSGVRGYGIPRASKTTKKTERRPRGTLPKSKPGTGKVIKMVLRQS